MTSAITFAPSTCPPFLPEKSFILYTISPLCLPSNAVPPLQPVAQINSGKYGVEFDVSLVRGQGYYTGTIFEIQSPDFKGSIGGGGRYDNLIGKFLGEDIPAVGFSIGFERIFSILSETGFEIPGKKRIAMLFEAQDFVSAEKKAGLSLEMITML